MRKLFILIALIFCIGLLFADNIMIVTGQQKKSSDKKFKPTPTPAPKEKYGLESLSLSKEKVPTWCHFKNWSVREGAMCSKSEAGIAIIAKAKIPDNTGVKYYYFVSGGKIIGDGENVFWDLSETRSGTYTITACIGKDNILIGEPITKSIKVEECDTCDPPFECPSISLSGPEKTIKVGDTVIVSANLSGEPQKDFQYKWSVSEGTIIAGQGTPTIFLKTPLHVGATFITAKVEVGGVNEGCQQIESVLISVSGGNPEK